jgi:hypothetical protein
MSWFVFDDSISKENINDFELEPEGGLIFRDIKVEEEFSIIFLKLEDEQQDGSSDTTKHVPS